MSPLTGPFQGLANFRWLTFDLIRRDANPVVAEGVVGRPTFVIALELMLVKFSTIYFDQKPIAWTNDVGSLSIAKGDHEVSAKFCSAFLDDRNLAPRMKVIPGNVGRHVSPRNSPSERCCPGVEAQIEATHHPTLTRRERRGCGPIGECAQPLVRRDRSARSRRPVIPNLLGTRASVEPPARQSTPEYRPSSVAPPTSWPERCDLRVGVISPRHTPRMRPLVVTETVELVERSGCGAGECKSAMSHTSALRNSIVVRGRAPFCDTPFASVKTLQP